MENGHTPVSNAPTYVTRVGRSWRSFDVHKFRANLQSSGLCNIEADATKRSADVSAEQQDAAVEQYNRTLTEILDRHAPVKTTTIRLFVNGSVRTPGLMRSVGLQNSEQGSWSGATSDGGRTTRGLSGSGLCASCSLEERRRGDFWTAKVSEQTNVRGTWRVINNILCRDEPKSSSTALSADAFADFFAKKIDDIRAATDGAPTPTFRDRSSGAALRSFQRLEVEDTVRFWPPH